MPADAALDALGDGSRREILDVLARGDRSVREIAEQLPISRPAVSRHLRVLKDAGLVAEEPAGARRIYRLRPEGAEAVREYLERLWGEAAGRFRLVAENTTPGVRAVTEPLRLDVPVACPAEHAFDVWTRRIDTWWPRDHSASGDPFASVVLEPRVGGRIYERTSEGEEHEWGEVTGWEPPHRLAYRWHLRSDPASATDVEIRFVADGSATRVEIEHTGWERLGAAADAWRNRNQAGWTTLLPHFVTAAENSDEGGEHG